MRYVKFNEFGFQEEVLLVEEKPGIDWYAIPEDNENKFYKLVSGAPVNMTEEEKDEYYFSLKTAYSYINLRRDRDELLTRSDWTQLPNSGLSESAKESWETYRQALRDLPETMTEDMEYTLPELPV
jgi:hypothetical protein